MSAATAKVWSKRGYFSMVAETVGNELQRDAEVSSVVQEDIGNILFVEHQTVHLQDAA